MHVIPVIDLMQGRVVRGVGGQRSAYRPVESILAPNPEPGTVASALGAMGFRTVYVADLDAIEAVPAGGQAAAAMPPCAWDTYAQIGQAGLELWVDAGISTADQAAELAGSGSVGRPIAGIVAGLESLHSPAALEAMIRRLGSQRLVFSLDLKGGLPLAREPAWQGLSPEAIAGIAWRCGVRRMIVLDLAAVGMGRGTPTHRLCRLLACRFPKLRLIAGGGVRGLRDLQSLGRAGCEAALVASALHDGRLDARRAAALRG